MIISVDTKKAFLSNECKEIEETNRMGKTRDLFKKIRDTKGTFHDQPRQHIKKSYIMTKWALSQGCKDFSIFANRSM